MCVHVCTCTRVCACVCMCETQGAGQEQGQEVVGLVRDKHGEDSSSQEGDLANT